MKLSVWAKQNGYSYRGAYNRYRKGNIVGAFVNETGRILIPANEENETLALETIVYARVSSPKQKNDLENQAIRVSNFCIVGLGCLSSC